MWGNPTAQHWTHRVEQLLDGYCNCKSRTVSWLNWAPIYSFSFLLFSLCSSLCFSFLPSLPSCLSPFLPSMLDMEARPQCMLGKHSIMSCTPIFALLHIKKLSHLCACLSSLLPSYSVHICAVPSEETNFLGCLWSLALLFSQVSAKPPAGLSVAPALPTCSS